MPRPDRRNPFVFGARDVLRAAQEQLPELSAALDGIGDGPCIADAIAVALVEWVRDADRADRDVVFRVLGLWDSVLARANTAPEDVDPEVVRVTVLALGLLRVPEQPWGRKALAQANPGMRRAMLRDPSAGGE